jgi:septum formation protein
VAPDVEEVDEGDPPEVVLENARRKAEAVAGPAPGRAVVLAADTEVVLDGRVLGKAADEDRARGYLERLSGRTHTVLGGLVIRTRSGEQRSGVAASEVTFKRLEADVVDLYLASGEWRDRAGAYAIQGLGSILIERLEGDFSNVVGLPVPLLLELAPELFAT